MKQITHPVSWGVLATLAATALMPVAAFADHQDQKNLGRNIGIGGAVVGLYGLTHHNTAASVLGIAGAVAGAKMYEDNRKAESRDSSRRHYYYRHHHRYYHRY